MNSSPLTDVSYALDMDARSFAEAGHQLIDRLAGFLSELPHKPVTTAEAPAAIRTHLGAARLPEKGSAAAPLLEEAAGLLFNHSLFNGHPSFWGYITSSATPIGALADLLAAAVNPNVGAYNLSPMATEIERQTIQWLCDFIGYRGAGGIFVSGGNMANFIGFLAARRAKAHWNIRAEGWQANDRKEGAADASRNMVVYCSQGTHTWIQKAADLFGLGTNAIRWIAVEENQQMDLEALEDAIRSDTANGYLPFLVVGTAGSVGTGAVDPLAGIARICRQHGLWFHVDGAYGAPAAVLPENAALFEGMSEADSIAMDPHKWLYSPLEAGCLLIKRTEDLAEAFSFHPEYFNFKGDANDPGTNFYDLGFQNSRGFRALKVWLGLRQAGREGYRQMIRDNIAQAESLYLLASGHEELEAVTHSLSITTFRYVPRGLSEDPTVREGYLNLLNERLLNALQRGGQVYPSHALVNGRYCLRVCIVNFRTQYAHLKELVQVVVQEGRRIDHQLRSRVGEN